MRRASLPVVVDASAGPWRVFEALCALARRRGSRQTTAAAQHFAGRASATREGDDPLSSIYGAAPKFSVGAVLRLVLSELGRRFGFYMGLMAIYAAPGFILGLVLPPLVLEGGEPLGARDPGQILLSMAPGFLIGFLVFAAMIGSATYAMVAGLRGRDIGLGAAVQEGLRSLIYAAPALLLQAIMVVIGFVALVIPGIVAILYTFVCVSVAAAESAPPGRAFKRSVALTEGYRVPILALLAITLFANFLFSTLVGGLSQTLFSAADAPISSETIAIYYFALTVLSLPLNALYVLLPVASYYLLSVEKDGRDSGDVAEVFQ